MEKDVLSTIMNHECQPGLTIHSSTVSLSLFGLTSRRRVIGRLQSCIMQLDFTKPENSGLGFALIGGANGSVLRVKEICTGGLAEQDGRLRVGDILLEVPRDPTPPFIPPPPPIPPSPPPPPPPPLPPPLLLLLLLFLIFLLFFF